MASYRASGRKSSALESFQIIRDTIKEENVSALAARVDLFAESGVIVTEDREDVYIRQGSSEIVVETPYAQEVSWLFYECKRKLDEVIFYFDKEEFFGCLAEAANDFMLKSDDKYGLLMAILVEASSFIIQTMQVKNQQVKDEVLSCVGSLTDLADKI